MTIYKDILKAKEKGSRLLAVLIDPDKFEIENTNSFITKVNESIATHIFVGGSIVANGVTSKLTLEIKKYTQLPVVLFPGDVTQISNEADGLLFLSLLSGRNPDYLITQQIAAVPHLMTSNLEVISTGYILINGGKTTAVEKVTGQKPIDETDIEKIVHTTIAGQFLGMKLIYLEAGSGAEFPVNDQIINQVKSNLSIPLIVGGGVRNKAQLEKAYNAGADLVVIGTKFEQDETFFEELKIN